LNMVVELHGPDAALVVTHDVRRSAARLARPTCG
jgi:hypothetical protein